MAYGGYSYLEPDYQPGKDDFIVLFWVKGKERVEKLAEAVASESSVGTWVAIKTMNEKVLKEYRARVFRIEKTSETSGYVFVAYPFQHFDTKNLLQFQASVLGNIFGLKELDELYVLDIKFPAEFQKQFKGPLYGLEGIRKHVGTTKNRRPHVGTIVKPKVGLAPKEFAQVAYDSWVGGLDLVKDDENLVDQEFCKWKERFDATFDAMDKAERETGEKKLYCTNITDVSFERMLDRMDYVVERGHNMIMLDVFILGFAALSFLVEEARKRRLAIHAHRAGYAAWHRGSFGINFQVLEKLYRMIGVDQLHIGTGVGKMEGGTLLIKHFHEIAEKRKVHDKLYLGALEFEFAPHIKPLMPVASGGLDPARMEALIALHGKNVTAQAGGGVHGHPKGTKAGARAMRQAAEAVAEGKSLKEYAKKHKELKEALSYFNYADPREIYGKLEFEKKNRDLLVEMVLSGRMSFREVWTI